MGFFASVRRLLLLGVAVFFSLQYAHAHASKLNPRLRLEKQRTQAAISGGFSVQDGSGAQAQTTRIDLLLQVAPGVTKDQLAARYPNSNFRTQIGTVITAAVSVTDLAAFEGDSDVRSAEAPTRLRSALNVIRSSTTSGGLILGSLDPAFTNFAANNGTGVIVGIVDSGIDWTHENFIYDSNPNVSKIHFIWDQVLPAGQCTSAQGAPAGFTGGCEYTQAEINAELVSAPGVVVSSDTDGHGTFVAGVAGGDGSATNGVHPAGTYAGVAKDAEFIIVKSSLTTDRIIDGINYLIARAGSLGKRLVINLSLSGQDGPHDGTSAFETAIAAVAVTTPVVVAMGNDHGLDNHASVIVPAGSNRTFHLVRFDSSSFITVDFWGVAGDTYTVTVTTRPTGGGSIVAGPDELQSGTLSGTAITVINNAPSALNGDAQLFLELSHASLIPADHIYVTFARNSVVSTGSGLMEGWVFDTLQMRFTGAEVDQNSTLGSPAVIDEVISVGSYCHKRQWRDITSTLQTDSNCTAGTLGDISNFSGRGPNRKGTLKPEISAPGEVVASAWSTAMDNPPGAAFQIESGFHRLSRGTSFSAPVITGIVALMLQKNPTATVTQIKADLAGDARTDSDVTNYGAVPNNTFGNGKATLLGCGASVLNAPGIATGAVLGTSSITWSWSLAANATYYNVYYATEPATLVVSTPVAAFFHEGLVPDTTYQFTVAGANACGQGPSALSVTTATFAQPIAAPTFQTEISSITVSYAPTASSGYVLHASTSANFSPPYVSSQTADSAVSSLRLDGLQALSTYYLILGALNQLGHANFTIVGTTTTRTSLVAPATGPVINATFNSLEPTWTLNDNPSGLQYFVNGSTDVNFAGSADVSSQTFNLFAAFMGLNSNTTYYFRVRPATGPFSVFDATATLAIGPVAAMPSFLPVFETSATAFWVDGGNPPGVRFLVETSSDAGFVSGVASSNTANTSLGLTGLDRNTVYTLRVAALSRLGVPSSFITASTMTLTDPPTPAAVPFGSVTTSVTVNWTPLPLAPSSATCSGYRVEFTTAQDFSGTRRQQTILDPAAGSLEITTLAPLTTYYFRVGAINAFNRGNFITIGSTVTSALILSSVTITNTTPVSVTVIPGFPVMPTFTVTAEVGALPTGVVLVLNGNVPFVFNPSASKQADLTPLGTGVGVDVTVGGAQPLKAIQLSFRYDPAFFPPGFTEEQIVLATARGGVWTVLPTSVDTPANVARAQTTHFTLFAPFFATPASLLDAVQVFPIPWKTGSGDRNFDSTDITFSNLPADSRVRIFTILGERVRTLSAGATGILRWDGKNKNGFDVGSGTYLAVIEGSGGRRVQRVVIIR